MISILPNAKDLFVSRNDPKDQRLGDLIRQASISEIENAISKKTAAMAEDIILLGYPDDEGIRTNLGRPGSALAPKAIRQLLYKMTPPLEGDKHFTNNICDLGDIHFEGNSEIKDRHEFAKSIAEIFYLQNKKVISFGGGHDYGYPDAAAFLNSCLLSSTLKSNANAKPIVINFDAHLDVRPTDKGINSGTPFYRLLEEFSTKDFDFLELGIQPQCNSQEHLKYLKQKNGKILFHNEIQIPKIKKSLGLNTKTKRPCFISLDIDVFHSSEAPGCSQSWPLGLTLEKFLPVFHFLIENTNVCGLGIYEVSPPLDTNMNTQRLAALITHDFIFRDFKFRTKQTKAKKR